MKSMSAYYYLIKKRHTKHHYRVSSKTVFDHLNPSEIVSVVEKTFIIVCS